jgi:hypothetical protein
MDMSTHTPPLHAALDYCARKLLAELERGRAALTDSVLASRLTPTTAALLRWWCTVEHCNTRVDNFHAGQRQAILHTVLAHELFQTDDPEWLYRLACDPARAWAEVPPASACAARYAGYVVRMAPGSGLRWVVQALLIWQWANHAAARASGRDDSRFSGDFLLLAANHRVRLRLQDALFGAADAQGLREVARSSPIRHAPLFLPLSLRTTFSDWLGQQVRSADVYSTDVDSADVDSALRIVDVANEAAANSPPITLVAGVGARMLGGAKASHDDSASSRHVALLWVDLALAQTSMMPCAGSTPIAEFPLERAIRDGAVKLPALEPTQHLRLPPLRATPPRRMGLRPRLSRAHRSLLAIGLQALSRRDAGFAALDPARRPKLLVLCDTPQVIRGVRHALTACGLDKSTIDTRVVIDTLPSQATLTDAHICVIVVLRTSIAAHAPWTLLASALAPLWPEPDFAVLRCENRERAVVGRAPAHLLDVLSVVEHPQCHPDYASLRRAGLAARDEDPHVIDATGDLIVIGLRADAEAFEIALPGMGDGQAECMERLSDLPRRVLRARQSMPVRKSVYTHAGWSAYDNGLRRAFLECAECDPGIESHCLLDPRRHAVRIRDRLLAQGISPLGLPDALVRTVDAVYLVEFVPSCPSQPQASGPCERALTRWCAHANTLPPTQRQLRYWRRVQLQAPLFWSWKRRDGALSALLAALAGTAPLTRPGRTPAIAD